MNHFANINSCYKNKNLSHVRTSHFKSFLCIFFPIPFLEEPHTKTKRIKTESISEDMETENVNDSEENVGTDKGILKGRI